MPAPAPLEYAPAPPWQRRRWFRRMVIAVCVLAFTAAAWRWGPEKWQRAKLLYWQHQCLHYSTSADEVVFDESPNGDSVLLKKPGYVRWLRPDGNGAVMADASNLPGCYCCLQAVLSSLPRTPEDPVVFLHERRSHSGLRYLVVLRASPFSTLPSQIGEMALYEDQSLVIEGWNNTPMHTITRPFRRVGSLAAPRHITVYAGQADPTDDSHFTVHYELDGKTATLDCYVEDIPLEGQNDRAMYIRFVPRQLDNHNRAGNSGS